MSSNNPYQIIKRRHVTEKSKMLSELKNSKSNPSVSRFENSKYVFIVDKDANKRQIADALEEIYRERGIKVLSVNTINVKGKVRRVRRFVGRTSSFKKAIVTFDKEDVLDNV